MRQWNSEIVEYERMKAYYKERGEELPYKSLGAFRRAVRKPHGEQYPRMQAWKRHYADSQQYERWKGTFTNIGPKSFEEFQRIKYAKNNEQYQLLLKAMERRKADAKQYEEMMSIVGKKYMPKSLDEFQEIKYNKNKGKEYSALKEIREQEKAYKVAVDGGAHSGKLVDYQKNFSIAALEKTVRNFDEKIALHINKSNEPEQYYPDWKKLDYREREGLIKHWRKEVSTFQRQKNIALAELRRRRDE